MDAREPRNRHPLLWLKDPPDDDAPVIALVLFRLRFALLALVVLWTSATVAYVLAEQYGWFDAVYMTAITLGTVGYEEVHPLHTPGRIVTIVVIVVSFTTLVYAVSVLTNLFVSGEAVSQRQNRRSKHVREHLRDHVIVVGFGRVGQAIVRGLRSFGRSCVVIDRNAATEALIRSAGAVEVIGDATDQENLRRAMIDRASAVIAACDSDDENLVVVLSARSMRPDVRIVARVNEATWLERMKQAGADVAQSPYPSYGMSLAAAATASSVLDVHELPLLGLGTEEIEIAESSPLIGSKPSEISQRHQYAYVIGLRRDDQLHPWHAVDGALGARDVLVVLGTQEHLLALAREAGGSVAAEPRSSSKP